MKKPDQFRVMMSFKGETIEIAFTDSEDTVRKVTAAYQKMAGADPSQPKNYFAERMIFDSTGELKDTVRLES